MFVTASISMVIWLAGSAGLNDEPQFDSRETKATQVATAFAESLLNGQPAVATALADVPFAWDRQKMIESLRELELECIAVRTNKGVRDLRITRIEVTLDENLEPTDARPTDLIVLTAWVGDQKMEMAVEPGDAYRVVGFSD